MNKLLHLLAAACLGFASVVTPAQGAQPDKIAIEGAYARATAPGQPAGGAFLQLDNHGSADRLVAASAPVSRSAELHVSRMEGDVMRMRQVDAIDLPAGQSVQLAPGGTHIMLMGLKGPLTEGQHFPLTLRFEKAGEVTVDVTVRSAGSGTMAPGMKHH
ncbi:MAG TPA: copper chaperone PCu(A)C [Albitalea sp.]|nr:copper chaperone PCu(A)C [Albitalea sp.]